MNFHRSDLFREPVLRRPPADSSERYVTAGSRPPAQNVASPVEQVRPRQLWQTIIVTRNARAVAKAHPEAFVIDHENKRIWLDDEWCGFSRSGRCTVSFQIAAALCCATTGHLCRNTLDEALWGDRRDGGPEYAHKIPETIIVHCRQFLKWAGLTRRSRYQGSAFEVGRTERDRSLSRFMIDAYGNPVVYDLPKLPDDVMERVRCAARRGLSVASIATSFGLSLRAVEQCAHDILTSGTLADRKTAMLEAWDQAADLHERETLAHRYGLGSLNSMRMAVGHARKTIAAWQGNEAHA